MFIALLADANAKALPPEQSGSSRVERAAMPPVPR
jgi:hypothetical protein